MIRSFRLLLKKEFFIDDILPFQTIPEESGVNEFIHYKNSFFRVI
jgi:hypothetical protein